MAVNSFLADPTRTAPIRRQYMAELSRRFAQLWNAIFQLLVTEDAFGLAPRVPFNPGSVLLNTRWQFKTDDAKLTEFKSWIKSQVDEKILTRTGSGTGPAWMDKYINSAHRQGIVRSFIDTHPPMNKSLDFYQGTQAQFLRDSFAQPEMVSKLKGLMTRNYEELNGVTDQMAREMARTLASGLGQGRGARDIARDLKKNVDFSKERALRVARTEVVHAHAEGQLDGFEELEVDEIGVMAEWSTAGDGRVCKMCSSLSGVVLTVKEARGLLPRHPNCRCAWIPANIGESAKGQKRGTDQIRKAFLRSAKAEKPKAENPKKQSRWLGMEKTLSAKERARIGKRAEVAGEPVIAAPAPALFNKQPTEALRWMGKEGWKFDEAKKVLADLGVDVSDATIKAQLYGGKTGTRGTPADFTPEQAKYLNDRRLGITPPPPIKPPPLPPPITPPPPPPPPIILPPPPIVPPPVVIGPKPDFTDSAAAVARWMGTQGFSFQEAKNALTAAGFNVSDATIRTQLGQGKRGQGNIPSISGIHEAFLRSAKGVVGKPDAMGGAKDLIPKSVKITPPKPQPPSPPSHITYTGSKEPSEFVKKVWDEVRVKDGEIRTPIKDENHAKKVGEIVKTEVDKRFGGLDKEVNRLGAEASRLGKELAEVRKKHGYGTPEQDEATIKWSKALTEWTKARSQLGEAYQKISLEVLSEIRDFGGVSLNFQAGSHKDAKDALTAGSKVLPKDWLNSINDYFPGGLATDIVPRGYFQESYAPGTSKTGLLKSANVMISGHSPSGKAETGTHELVHAMEKASRQPYVKIGDRLRLGELESAYLGSRRKPGEALTHIDGGEPHEMGYKDEFTNHYIGRDYSSPDSWEILTMGVEGLMHNKYGVKNDPDMIKFVLGILAGY